MKLLLPVLALALAAGSVAAHESVGVSFEGGSLCAKLEVEVGTVLDQCVDGLPSAAAAGCEVATEPLLVMCTLP